MRLLASLPRYPPRSLVGAFLSTHECLRHMVGRGHDVTVATGEAEGLLDGVKVVPARAFVDLVAGADVVLSHLHDGGSAGYHAMCNAKPLVRMVHGGGEPKAIERLDQYPTALAVFASYALAEEVGWGGPSIICQPPVDLDAHRTEPGDRVTLVNLSELKGGRLFWRIAEALPDVDFLGVLGGWGEQITEPLVDHPNVQVIPPTRHMAGVWSRTRILLMPSERESFGRVALEAAASGIPTVGYRCSGLLEALGPHGATWVLSTGGFAVDRWVAALEELLANPHAFRLKAGRARDRAARYRPGIALERFAHAVEELDRAQVPA